MILALSVYCVAFATGLFAATRASRAAVGVPMPYGTESSTPRYNRLLTVVSWGAAGGSAFSLAGGSFVWWAILFAIAMSPGPLAPVFHNQRLGNKAA
jgi:hypothetical protein